MTVPELSEGLDLISVKSHNWWAASYSVGCSATELRLACKRNACKPLPGLPPTLHHGPLHEPALAPCCRHVQASCALTGEGLLEGLQWVAEELRRKEAAPHAQPLPPPVPPQQPAAAAAAHPAAAAPQ